MADSDTEICNMALGHLAIDNDISTLDTERSAEARACRKFFVTVRDQTLRDFPYPFAKKMVALALVATDPNDEWGYSYRYPSDCLMARRILSGTRQDTRDTRVPYLEGADTTGQLIYCDTKDAELEYTFRVDEAIRYPSDFVMAMSLRLASVIAPQLTGGDPFKLGVAALQRYRLEMGMAKANAANEEQVDQYPDAESIRARL